MRRFVKGRYGLILIGILLLGWGATSAFSDLARIRSSQPDLIDNPDASGSQVIIPAQTLVYATPTPESVQGTAEPDDSSAFSVPLVPGSNSAEAPQIQATNSPTKDTSSTKTSESTSQVASPTPTQPPVGLVPERIVIPAIKLDAPIIPVPYRLMLIDKQVFQQYSVPDKFAAGWQSNSAMIGVPGNTVLNGHHNVWGEVFGKLVDLNPGDVIEVYSGNTMIKYQIRNKMILPERDEPINVRFQNARWLLPSNDERLTLVTCWPHWTNTHRLIIVATPIGRFTVNSTTPQP
jgi:sortase A